MDVSPKNLRFFPFYFTEYGWLGILCIFFLIGFFIPFTHNVGIIESVIPDKPLSDEGTIQIFGHLTDTHVNVYNAINNLRLNISLQQIIASGVRAVLHTGDLIDNWGKEDEPGYANQFKPDGEIYGRIISIFPLDSNNFIEVTGNHDQYGVYSFDSKHHYFLNYSHFYKNHPINKIEDYWYTKTTVNDTDILIMNPTRYPSAHARLNFWINPSIEQLDLYESKLSNITRPTILLCHFPISLWDNLKKSTNGKSISEILQDSNVSLILTGHLHPRTALFEHHKSVLEVVGSDSKGHKNYGLVSMDNGNTAYHSANIEKPLKAIVTYPIPKMQLTKMVVFNQKKSFIHVVAFSKSEEMQLYVNGAGYTNQKMKWIKSINELQQLYSLPLDVDQGEYHISISGDWNYEMDFVVSDSIKIGTEKTRGYRNLCYLGISVLVVFCIIFLLITFPFYEFKFSIRLNSWVMGQEDQQYWIYSMIFGYFAIRTRIRMLPIWFRVSLFIAVLWPLVLPIALIEVESHYGFVWLYGYFVDSVYYDVYGQFYGVAYYVGNILPIIFFSSALSVSKPWNKVLLIDIVVGSLGLVTPWIITYFSVYEAVNFLFAFTSFTFIIIPYILYSMLFVIIYRSKHMIIDNTDKSTSTILKPMMNHDLYLA